ncbi:hypothetical protein ABZ192_23950 [Streptomyces sp. NPDC006235]|uniref:hypothetical protein n=1 Tax=Streptomyces sp. NPDC006235 TaxID=3156736 RepID=UPI0033A2D089
MRGAVIGTTYTWHGAPDGVLLRRRHGLDLRSRTRPGEPGPASPPKRSCAPSCSRPCWDEIEVLWLAGELADDEFEDHFIDDVIVEGIGEGTDGWQNPGASYAVELR